MKITNLLSRIKNIYKSYIYFSMFSPGWIKCCKGISPNRKATDKLVLDYEECHTYFFVSEVHNASPMNTFNFLA